MFCITLNPLSALLENSKYGCHIRSGTTINPLLYMDDIKLSTKNERDIDSLIHLTRIFSKSIGMAFSLGKCGCLIVSRGRIKHTGGQVPDENIDDKAERYNYLGMQQALANKYNIGKQFWRTKLSDKGTHGNKHL